MSFSPKPTFGNDTIYGDDQDDTIFALDGNDVVYGGAGNDMLDGGLGSDTLYGDAGNDVLYGGDDLLPPGKEADLFGSDYFPGNDTLVGGAGDDSYLFGRSSRSDRIVETAVMGEANQVRFEAGVMAADVVIRHEGNDLNFYIVGFIDNKLSVVDYFTSTVRPITAAVFSDGTVWTSADFEAAPLGPIGNGDRFIRGTDGNDTLTGLGGNDTIDGKDGNDRIFGGDGNDYLLGGAGRDVLAGGNGNDVILGGSGSGDQLLGGAGDDTLRAGEGDDFLDGGTGNDVLDAGAGRNRIIFQQGDGQDIVRGTASAGGYFGTTLEFVKTYAVGSLGSSPVGIASSEVVLTRSGDNLVIDRNDGDDRVTVENYFASSAAGLYPIHSIWFSDTNWNNADINAHVVGGTPTPPPTTLPPVVPPTGTNGNEVSTGVPFNDFLNGMPGIVGLEEGPNADSSFIDYLLKLVTQRPDEGPGAVQNNIDITLGANTQNLSLVGSTDLAAAGNALANTLAGNGFNNIILGDDGNDVLFGDAGDDFLNGELGQDQMFGGVGNDTVIVNDAGDFVWEVANEGIDTVQSYIDYTLPANFENLILIGRTGLVAHGNALDNMIQGNDSDNDIDGMGGLDTLFGNGGNDRLTIHSGKEMVDGGSGFDTLQLGADLATLNLAGLAGTSLIGIECIDMRNGSATTVQLNLTQLLALSMETNTLRIDGEMGDQVQIGAGWQHSTSSLVGYDQYTATENGNTGILLVGQAITVTTGS